jgi:predicted permease
MRRLFAGFRNLLHRTRRDADLDAELRAFYEASVEAKLAAGMPRAQAERAARIELGSPAAVKDWVRDVAWTTRLEAVWQDARYALRLLARQPGFTVAAVLTLALGIGATTAIFTLVDRVMLRPLPLSDPDRVVTLHAHQGESVSRTFTHPPFLRLREHATAAFDLVSASGTRSPRVRVGDDTRLTPAAFITEDYFDLVGVRPFRGRFFAAEEYRPGAPPVLVVTEAFWRTRMAADPNAIGRTIRVGDLDAPVVGIAPRGIRGLHIASPVDIFLPLMTAEAVLPPANYFQETTITVGGGGYSPQAWLTVAARLRPGVSVEQAEALLSTMAIDSPPRAGTAAATMRLVPTVEEALRAGTRTDTRRFAGLLALVVSLVLLIGCANLAGLILARNEHRRRETAVRLALGARAGRVVRMFIVEATMLSLGGGIAGLLAAIWMLQVMGAFVIPGAIRIETLELGMTWRVFLFAAGAAIFTALATGLIPAVAGSRMDVSSAMKARVGAPISERNLMRGVLVAAQVGISLILIVGALLFVRSLLAALATDVGTDTRRVAYATVWLPGAGYDDDRLRHFLGRISERLAALPDIERVTFGPAPLAGSGPTPAFRIDGVDRQLPQTFELGVGPDYFETLGIRVISGRPFGRMDHDQGAPNVVVVNEAFSQHAWPGQNPVGRRVGILPQGADMEVVGIARDAKFMNLAEGARPAVYYPWHLERVRFRESITVRSAGDAAASVPAILREIRRLDPDLTITESGTLEERIARLAMTQRIGASLLSWFGVLAFALAIAGTYGLIAYAVARRTGEIGVRIALGAQPGDVVRMMMRRSLVPVAVGIVLGIAGAFGLTKLVAGFLFGIEPHDPMSFAGAALALTLGAALASYVPARRAAHVDPVVALRAE